MAKLVQRYSQHYMSGMEPTSQMTLAPAPDATVLSNAYELTRSKNKFREQLTHRPLQAAQNEYRLIAEKDGLYKPKKKHVNF